MKEIERAIFHAVRAGAFRLAGETFPAARDTFRSAAEINSARSKAALGMAMAGCVNTPSRMRSE